MKHHSMRLGFLFLLVLLGGCSGGAAETGSDVAPEVEPAQAQATSVPTAAPTPQEPTPAPTASPTPVPTSTPIPEPIFQRSTLLKVSVSDSTRAMFRVAAPQGDFDWLGAGHDYDPIIGRSVPVIWNVTDSGAMALENLPLGANPTSGNANRVAVIADRQVVGGLLRTGDRHQAVAWSRDAPTSDWVIDNGLAEGLGDLDDNQSSVLALTGSDTWGAMVVRLTSDVDFDENGDPVLSQHLLTTNDGVSWAELILPSVSVGDWAFGVHADGSNGLIVAKNLEDDVAQSKFFVTTDSGAAWQEGDVELADGQPATIHDVLWRDGALFIVGSIGVEGERRAAIFVQEGDVWKPQLVLFTPATSFESGDVELIEIEQLDGGRVIGAVDTHPGTITVTSRTGTLWTERADLWPNSDGDNDNADLYQLVPDPAMGRFMAVRGFSKPVWLNDQEVTLIDAPEFDRENRRHAGLVVHDGQFVTFSQVIGGPIDTHLLRSPDGLTWKRTDVDEQHVPAGPLLSEGPTILSWGGDGEASSLRRYFEGRPSISLPITPLLGLGGNTRFTIPEIALGDERNLFTTLHAGDDAGKVIFTFFASFDPDDMSAFEVPSLFGAEPTAACPQLPSGEFVVALRNPDAIGSSIEVWRDAPQPRIGPGVLTDNGDLSASLMLACNRLGSGLVMGGATCSPQAVSDRRYSDDECEPALWTSSNGVQWAAHPANGQLAEAEVAYTSDMVTFDGGALVIGIPNNDSSRRSLWLVTPDDVVRVPTKDVFTVNNFDLVAVEVNGNRVMLQTATEIFVGDLDYLLERTRSEAPSVQDQPDGDSDSGPTPEPSPAAVTGDTAATTPEPEPILLPPLDPAAPAAPAATPVPPAVNPTPVPPPPTAAPVAPPTAEPAPTAVPTPDTGSDSSGSSDSEGESLGTITLSCIVTTNAQTGEVTETCE